MNIEYLKRIHNLIRHVYDGAAVINDKCNSIAASVKKKNV